MCSPFYLDFSKIIAYGSLESTEKYNPSVVFCVPW